jgi:hypothetical protein
MGKAAKLRQARKNFKVNCQPIPNYESLKTKFESTELRNWVIKEWSYLIDFELFVLHHQKQRLASMMLERLYLELAEGYGKKDARVEYNLNHHIKTAVGVNIYSWTVWAFIGDRKTGFDYATPDKDEFVLMV